MFRFIISFSILISAPARAIEKSVLYPSLYRSPAVLVMPSNMDKMKTRPLVVLLHGCKITAEDILAISEIEKYVDKNDFAVVAPNQTRVLNADNCWNFWHPLNQQPFSANLFTSGEEIYSDVAYISRTIEQAMRESNANPREIYLAGISSGAAIALNVLMCDGDHNFAGIAISAGAAFAAANDLYEAQELIRVGSGLTKERLKRKLKLCPRAGLDKVKFSIVHGDKDKRIVPANFYDILKQFETPRDNSGRIQFLLIQNLEHKWSGSRHPGPYGDASTIPFTPLFLRHFGIID